MKTKKTMIRFTASGRLVIPRNLRKEFEIAPGTRAYVPFIPRGILIRPVIPKIIRSLHGSLTATNVMDIFMAE